MQSPNSTFPDAVPDASYDRITIALHWAVAVAIVLTYGLGLAREAAPRGPSRDLITSLHMSLGLFAVVGAAVRLSWRATHWRAGAHSSVTALLARVAHVGLYAGMVAVPLLGILMHWYKGRTIGFFGVVQLPSPFVADRSLAKLLEEAHELVAHGLMALVGIHAAAALFHHYALKDGVLMRMMPRRA